MFMACVSCNTGVKLKKVVEEFNKSCPMEVDEYTTLERMTDEGNYLVCNYTVHEEDITIAVLRSFQSTLKDNLICDLKTTGDKDVEDLLKVCKEYNRGLIYRYKGNISGEILDIVIEQSEL